MPLFTDVLCRGKAKSANDKYCIGLELLHGPKLNLRRFKGQKIIKIFYKFSPEISKKKKKIQTNDAEKALKFRV